MSMNGHSDWTELHSRESDGITVKLVWSKAANVCLIDLHDSREMFGAHGHVFPVDNACALDAFHHPYPYLLALMVELGFDPDNIENVPVIESSELYA